MLPPKTNASAPAEAAKPPRIAPRIKAAPAIRQIYWCDFWTDAQLPELWKRRPALIVSFKNTLYGPCTVLPASSIPQDDNPWAHKLSFQPDGRTDSWVICNQPVTLAPSRFSQFHGTLRIPRVGADEFDRILARLLQWLPKPSA